MRPAASRRSTGACRDKSVVRVSLRAHTLHDLIAYGIRVANGLAFASANAHNRANPRRCS